MEKVNTSYRLKSIMSERNLRQIDILNLTKPYCEKYNIKMNKSDISQYVSGKNEPSQDKLVILAMALGVNEAWLMGFNAKKERNSNTNEESLDAFRNLLKSLGWSCEFLECISWASSNDNSTQKHPTGCIHKDNIQRTCNNCYMKGPKYVFSNGNTSFEISPEDYLTFVDKSESFILKSLQELMLRSTTQLFENETELNAAHARTDIDIPEGTDTSDNDIMDDEDF